MSGYLTPPKTRRNDRLPLSDEGAFLHLRSRLTSSGSPRSMAAHMQTDSSNWPPLYLSTGDPNFADLFGGRDRCQGIYIPRGKTGQNATEDCTTGASVVITGPPGSGKTLLACQISATSIQLNDKIRSDLPGMPASYWPPHSLIVYYTSDQTANEIEFLCKSFAWGDYLKFDKTNRWDLAVPVGSLKKVPDHVNMVIIEMPYETTLDKIPKHIEVLASRVMNDRPAIIAIDAINMHMKRGPTYDANFRELIKFAHSSGLSHVNLLVVLEEGHATPMMEEYVPQCVIRLGRGRGIAPSRTIEISKARHQAPLIGEHEFSVFPGAGIKIFPSVSSRARQWRDVKSADVGNLRNKIKFGHLEIDKRLEVRTDTSLFEGSTTLIWGPPGTRKTDLCVEFAAAQLKEDPESSVMLLTTKIAPNVFRDSLFSEITANSPERINFNINEHLFVVDGRDPYRSPASMLAEVVDFIEHAKNKRRLVRRAVVFGLSLLDETPSVRDDQWRFVSVLVNFFESKNVASILVDWPLEGVAGGSQANPRPRASKLCGTEIMMEFHIKDKGEKGFPRIHLLRSNYTAIGAEIDYKKAETENAPT
jgi:KaiC/GvpD/RAD55 family RecA-like ATPase